MTTRVVRIGNSQGVRIPKPLLEQAGLTGEVEMVVENDGASAITLWSNSIACSAGLMNARLSSSGDGRGEFEMIVLGDCWASA